MKDRLLITALSLVVLHCVQAGDDEMEETFLQSVKQEGAAYSVPAVSWRVC